MQINSLSRGMRFAASGLTAERTRLDVISENIANADTIRIPGRDPYRQKGVILASGQDGVEVRGIRRNFRTEIHSKFDPSHDFANEEGKVETTNVNPIIEMVDMMSASRAYEANLTAFNSAKTMQRAALNIGRV